MNGMKYLLWFMDLCLMKWDPGAVPGNGIISSYKVADTREGCNTNLQMSYYPFEEGRNMYDSWNILYNQLKSSSWFKVWRERNTFAYTWLRQTFSIADGLFYHMYTYSVGLTIHFLHLHVFTSLLSAGFVEMRHISCYIYMWLSNYFVNKLYLSK